MEDQLIFAGAACRANGRPEAVAGFVLAHILTFCNNNYVHAGIDCTSVQTTPETFAKFLSRDLRKKIIAHICLQPSRL